LRALGVRARRIFSLFVARSLLGGLAGAALGCAAGCSLGAAWLAWEGAADGTGAAPSFDVWLLLAVLAIAPLVSAAAALLPAMLAAQQDPAQVLRET